MKGKTLAILIAITLAVTLYILWSGGKLAGTKQGASDVLPALTETSETVDIQKDLEETTVSEDDEGFVDIEAELKVLQ